MIWPVEFCFLFLILLCLKIHSLGLNKSRVILLESQDSFYFKFEARAKTIYTTSLSVQNSFYLINIFFNLKRYI